MDPFFELPISQEFGAGKIILLEGFVGVDTAALDPTFTFYDKTNAKVLTVRLDPTMALAFYNSELKVRCLFRQ